MLARSGVGRLRLIDFDQVSLSSLNRHALASLEDVGTSKAECIRKQILKIVPWCQIEAETKMFRGADAEFLLRGKPDYVLDCIDDVSTKAELIAWCLRNEIEVMTSMGAGGKSDPTKLRIGTLADCVRDPLASKIKWKLRKTHGVEPEDVTAVYSVQKAVVNLLPLDDAQAAAPHEFGAVDYVRLRVIPVLGTSPSIFGQAMAAYTLCARAGSLFLPESAERMSKNLRHKLRQLLTKNEKVRFGNADALDFDEDDLELVVQQIWGARCAVTGRRFGGHAPLCLTRWDPKQPPVLDNLVLLAQGPMEQLLSADGDGRQCFSEEVISSIEETLAWARDSFQDELRPQGSAARAARADGQIPPHLASHYGTRLASHPSQHSQTPHLAFSRMEPWVSLLIVTGLLWCGRKSANFL
jgi:tRNA A37 threonylcarbamoyladenosine dehydratase